MPADNVEDSAVTTPLIPDPSALAGDWRLRTVDGQDCAINLGEQAQPLEAGSLAAPVLAVDGRCAAVPGLAGWRAAPLGLELTDAAGFAVLTFEQVGADEYVSSATGARLTRQ